MPASDASARKRRPCGLLPLRVTVTPCRRLWPPLRASPDYSRPPPCRVLAATWSWVAGPARGWPWVAAHPPCCLCCENVARTRRMILDDSISSHVV
ncbi:hypothetical protein BHM03_00039126 [Ensete ventricosum]|nr:hypothetical protein BHM03_00039126 [Ensete ventricosum]